MKRMGSASSLTAQRVGIADARPQRKTYITHRQCGGALADNLPSPNDCLHRCASIDGQHDRSHVWLCLANGVGRTDPNPASRNTGADHRADVRRARRNEISLFVGLNISLFV